MEFFDILKNFQIDGEFVSCEPYGSGLINRTYVAVYNTATNKAVSAVYNVSIEAYAQSMLNNYNDVVMAMMKYGDAVVEYRKY